MGGERKRQKRQDGREESETEKKRKGQNERETQKEKGAPSPVAVSKI